MKQGASSPGTGVSVNVLGGDYDGAREALDRALAIARENGDLVLEMQVTGFHRRR